MAMAATVRQNIQIQHIFIAQTGIRNAYNHVVCKKNPARDSTSGGGGISNMQ
jgi:hypothetical protein